MYDIVRNLSFNKCVKYAVSYGYCDITRDCFVISFFEFSTATSSNFSCCMFY